MIHVPGNLLIVPGSRPWLLVHSPLFFVNHCKFLKYNVISWFHLQGQLSFVYLAF